MRARGVTSRKFFFNLSVIHAAMCAGIVLFGTVAVFLNLYGDQSGNTGSDEISGMLQILVPIAALGAVFIGRAVFKNGMKNIDENQKLNIKLSNYQSNTIIYSAILEGAALFSIVSYLLTDDLMHLGIAGLLFIILLINRPTRHKAIEESVFSREEKDMICDREAIVA